MTFGLVSWLVLWLCFGFLVVWYLCLFASCLLRVCGLWVACEFVVDCLFGLVLIWCYWFCSFLDLVATIVGWVFGF